MNEEFDNEPLTLEKAFNFTWEDLAENRQGRVSEAQKQRLRQFPKRFLYAFLLVLGFGVLYFAFITIFPNRRNLSPEIVIFTFGAMLAALIPVILFQ
jgi:polyferredoxin